jgi:hypothetical protein
MWTSLALVVLVVAQAGQDPEDVVEPSSAPSTPSTSPANDEVTATIEARDVHRLQRLEGILSLGRELSASERDELLALARSPSPRARAVAAAVLPWLPPELAATPLGTLTRDTDARVRVTAAQSLTSIARRVSEQDRSPMLEAGIRLLDDDVDEVACAGAELLSVLQPPALVDAFEARVEAASNLRHACFVRFGGVATRPVKVPALPTSADLDVAVDNTATASSTTSARMPSWLHIATAAGAGLVIGGAIPGALVPARDVLVYDDDVSRLSRQDISVATQAGAALLGAAALGGGAWLLDDTLRLSPDGQAAVVGGTGAGALLGAGLSFMLDVKGGAPAWLIAGSTGAGLVGATALAAFAPVSADDNAVVMATIALAGLGGGLGAFTAIPVALTDVGGVGRTDFGFGSVFAAAGALGLGSLALAPIVEVPAARSAAVAAGGLLGAGLLGGVAFAVVPANLETGSRFAAGAGLAGQALGMAVGALLIPNAWLSIDDVDERLDIGTMEKATGETRRRP